LEVIHDILLEIFESHDDATDPARAARSDHRMRAGQSIPGFKQMLRL
jgi:hypothetical protein